MDHLPRASRALFAAVVSIILWVGIAGAFAGQNKIANDTIGQKPALEENAAKEAPLPGARGSQTEALGAYLFILPRIMNAIPGAENIVAGFGWGNKSPQPLTDMLDPLLMTKPQTRSALEAIIKEQGFFASLRDWAQTGDEFTLGMMGAGMKRDNPAAYDRVFTLTEKELLRTSDEMRPTFEFLRAMSDEEKEYYESYREYYEEMIERYAARP